MRSVASASLGGGALVVLLAAGCGGTPSPSQPEHPTATPAPVARPNLVVVLADDLDLPTFSEMARPREQVPHDGDAENRRPSAARTAP
jgi:hypothetical protein